MCGYQNMRADRYSLERDIRTSGKFWRLRSMCCIGLTGGGSSRFLLILMLSKLSVQNDQI